MAAAQYLSVHCHYYQPPRGNPISGAPLIEPDAAPYSNWNDRITAECYKPNADMGNFGGISFNFGDTLASWLAEHAPETYKKIIEADTVNFENYSVGNAIAQPLHHTILPLSNRSDKDTQVKWGRSAFEHRFGHQTDGLWMPEMAVDTETLEVMLDNGVRWTILSESQVIDKPAGGGPYWLRLPDNRRIAVFVRDDQLSNDMAFNLGRFGGAGRWAREVLVPRRRDAGTLTLIASDGETFGHHWPGEEQFLRWLLGYEARSAGYEVTNLSRFLRETEPKEEIEFRENSAWSCLHGLSRWSTGCGCTIGLSYWKGAVRRAMDNLRFELDGVFDDYVKKNAVTNSTSLRNAYFEVMLGKVERAKFLAGQDLSISDKHADSLLLLTEAQYYRQCMYASCTWFFADLDTHTARYGITNAAYAALLTKEATGVDLTSGFRRDLSIALGQDGQSGQPLNGGQIFDQIWDELQEDRMRNR